MAVWGSVVEGPQALRMNPVRIGSLEALLVWNRMWWDLFAHQLPMLTGCSFFAWL